MYPQIHNNVDYGLITDDNKHLCKDLCKVGLCLTCFCSAYLILFLGVIDSELSNMNMTYF